MTTRGLSARLERLEQAGGVQQFFWYCLDHYDGGPRYVLPGGQETDGDTFTLAVERAGRHAVVVRIEYAEDWRATEH